MSKLKGAYRHPFEYINPRLYQKKNTNKDPADDTIEASGKTRFFVEETEFLALQDNSNMTNTRASLIGALDLPKLLWAVACLDILIILLST